MAENTHPTSREALKTNTMMKSSSDLAYSVDGSWNTPSWMAPTMAIAPMHTVSVVVTNPSMNSLFLALPLFCLSHAPKRSSQPSMSIQSPTIAPMASDTMSIMENEPWSMDSIEPEMARNSTHTPLIFINSSCVDCFKYFPKSMPPRPPTAMAPTFTIVPIQIPSFRFPIIESFMTLVYFFVSHKEKRPPTRPFSKKVLRKGI